MVAPDTFSGPRTELNYNAAVLDIQRRAAESAANVGQFRSNFHTYAEDVLEGRATVSFSPSSEDDSTTVTEADGEFTIDASAAGLETASTETTVTDLRDEQKAQLRSAIQSHDETVVSAATGGIQSLGVEEMPEGQLGEAEIGGSGRVSKNMLGTMKTAADAKQANHAGKHEQGHMQSVRLKGELIVDGETEGPVALYESYAELTGNRGVGEGAHYFRPGQPEDYEHAQKLGILLEAEVGKADYEQTLTGDGNLSRLQKKLDEKGRGRTDQQVEDGVGEEAEEELPMSR
ncbi:hypothetical protein COU78_00355 [Candidatus Peregrinibacteria bacterium CG10_big_fil_rev_8_21_14_0_10_49_24]|nr:MAG: hypothetical protein COV83_06400 [Candidatus Peregrinibacteria bacterium CG11_big_fil_rev_8_21_14_0_20_49_14]PIR51639.1 MAG: hypothetical protein COU78_00355 [Candidatus Peregrinibacteria bacterium CG10_big_fil_rev_8_21_14_0_10_49_24]PJA68001.1 MAG: hypothetical protein CO157_01605 [Candidatus Peregrinibacteria bacterium CG_4_9_14_3_um_filter_49_12]